MTMTARQVVKDELGNEVSIKLPSVGANWQHIKSFPLWEGGGGHLNSFQFPFKCPLVKGINTLLKTLSVTVYVCGIKFQTLFIEIASLFS